jgi:outer membrane protein OmpA-like peptidoglycan-associated protein
VRNQVTPIIDKVNQLDDETAKNTNEINTVNTSTDQALVELNTRTDEAIARASDAQQRTTTAQAHSDQALQSANNLATRVANLDNYKLVSRISVRFAFSAGALDNPAKKILDNFGADAANRRNYVITVEGATDSTGGPDSNYDLSDRRANAVRTYLATRYGVPALKIHVVGLGSDKPAATNRTSAGRAQNRRADVQLFSLENKVVTAPSGEAGATADDESDTALTRLPQR